MHAIRLRRHRLLSAVVLVRGPRLVAVDASGRSRGIRDPPDDAVELAVPGEPAGKMMYPPVREVAASRVPHNDDGPGRVRLGPRTQSGVSSLTIGLAIPGNPDTVSDHLALGVVRALVRSGLGVQL
jgi:hypothetical protein